MAKHTPLPWFVSASPDYWNDGAIVVRAYKEDSGVVVAPMTKLNNGSESGPNAEFIVRACNSYYKMLAALKAVREEAISYVPRGETLTLSPALLMVLDAISDAESNQGY